jgi:endogenous inhibitor of DNA gyrase (YacG/DUF329 family)
MATIRKVGEVKMSEERGKIECPFCRSDNNIPINRKNPFASVSYTPESHWREDADPEFKYNHSEWTIYIRSGRTSVQFRIFFCPICGRKLPEKKEVK